jgi:heme exporter protein A
MTLALPFDFKPVCVRVGSLSLSRGGRTLVTGLGFAAAPGDALVVTGPNGSGKTTLLRTLAGFIKPDAGEINITASQGEVKIAFLGHSEGLKPGESVGDALGFWARLNGVEDAAIEPVMRRMAVAHLESRACGTLSAGQRRRTAIARLALTNAGVWILDEPTAPLDEKSRRRLADLIAEYRVAGGVVIATTHAALDWPDQKQLDLTQAATAARASSTRVGA